LTGANRKRGIVMKYLKLIAALLVVLTLGACVGFIVPVPLPASSSSQESDRGDRR
jgi:hypothetical protein